MNKSVIVAAAAALLFMSCSENRVNPFFEESKLPYGAVEFDKIQSTDYMPAFEEGFRQFKLPEKPERGEKKNVHDDGESDISPARHVRLLLFVDVRHFSTVTSAILRMLLL